MKRVLNIGLDVGSDSMKIAYAYEKDDGGVEYGKFDNEFMGGMVQAGLPAQAFYDSSAARWYFADEIERSGSDSFYTVVKIKKLISLLAKRGNGEAVAARNREYYLTGHLFPRFFFPDIRGHLNGIDETDFQSLVDRELTFEAPKDTPQSVCEAYFRHVKEFTDRKIAALEARAGFRFSGVRYALIFPPEIGQEYVDELERILRTTFHAEPFKVLSTTRALAMYASHEGILSREGEDILAFDMGEENVSVAKAGFRKGKIYLDGADGHNLPLGVGGVDIDEAIEKLLEEKIAARPAIGSCNEEIVYSKQYRLMKDIKSAKVILGEEDSDTDYPYGVPLWIDKEVTIKTYLTKKEVYHCIVRRPAREGDEGSVAKRIVDYMKEELERLQNRQVKVLFLSGGLAESEPLVSYIRREIAKYDSGLRVETFDLRADGTEERDEFTLRSTEDGVYAPAIGGAIVALKDYDIATEFVFSYGTFARERDILGTEYHRFSIVVDRGQSVQSNASECMEKVYFWSFSYRTATSGVSYDYSRKDGDLYAAVLTEQEIKTKAIAEIGCPEAGDCFKRFSDGWGLVEEELSKRKPAQKALQWALINPLGIVNFFYKGRMVGIQALPQGSSGGSGVNLSFRSGMRIDLDGHAQRIILNTTKPGIATVEVCYISKAGSGKDAKYRESKNAPLRADLSEIELRLEDTHRLMLK